MSEIVLSESFYPLLEDKHRYLVLCGGRGSGKSEFAARKIFYRCLNEGNHRFLILRKVRKTCGVSVIKVFQVLLRESGIAFEFNKSDHIIRFNAPNGTPNELLFDGLDEPEKIKSIKGLTGMWIEEATEFTESEFVETDLVLREPGPSYKQIILSFNPDEVLAPWLKKRFFDSIDPDACVHVSTVEDNPIASIRIDYKKQLSLLTDEALRKIYLYGMWAAPRGRIYDWDVQALPITILRFDDIFYGGDFGYSVNPAALIKIYRKADEFWLQEMLYEKGLTNQDIGNRMIGDPDIDVRLPGYWDSAEQKSIEEIYRMGVNAIPALKGPDSVRAGIDFLKSKKIHILPGSLNIIREAGKYTWRKDKNDVQLPEPVKFDDHALDAIRYGIYTHCRGAGEAYAEFSEKSVY
jgi:phage terminase large subunit